MECDHKQPEGIISNRCPTCDSHDRIAELERELKEAESAAGDWQTEHDMLLHGEGGHKELQQENERLRGSRDCCASPCVEHYGLFYPEREALAADRERK